MQPSHLSEDVQQTTGPVQFSVNSAGVHVAEADGAWLNMCAT